MPYGQLFVNLLPTNKTQTLVMKSNLGLKQFPHVQKLSAGETRSKSRTLLSPLIRKKYPLQIHYHPQKRNPLGVWKIVYPEKARLNLKQKKTTPNISKSIILSLVFDKRKKSSTRLNTKK